ncbi:DUF1398 domain-containing protein [Paraflavitalea pollutisoli]|uniref:DUF1398 domain-containing protein n=1 Tax=Paraflavitalea pollutisoli TaxID=3034143 RepID=UPI0023EAF1F5|nr:DUF1398 family protein [Paraflavitalea sp. H1-2-19X]
MFTIEQIQQAHAQVKSGADFPAYIRDLKTLGVTGYETWVADGHTNYFGANAYSVISKGKYDALTISGQSDKAGFQTRLKSHQDGQTDYMTFCRDCAATGIEKWIVDLARMTCTYYDRNEQEILTEAIPG